MTVDTAMQLSEQDIIETQSLVKASSMGQYISFQLEHELFGVNILDVKEVTPLHEVTPVFHAPKEIAGSVNLRGVIHMIIDFRELMGLPPKAPTEASRVIIFKPSISEPCGILVDEVKEVVSIDPAEIEPRSVTDERDTRSDQIVMGVSQLQGNMLVIIDSKKILGS